MIVCQCQKISDHDIHYAIDWMRASDSETLITPGKVYRVLGKAADCGSCMTLFLDTMRNNPNLEIPLNLCNIKKMTRKDGKHARQKKSHRLPQPSAQE
ncbi:MAG: (2Fe-2S)-binding protein [Aestuariivita sp.]|nr:(2Fe-2S)-binding protein [Aestuariivita sp.]